MKSTILLAMLAFFAIRASTIGDDENSVYENNDNTTSSVAYANSGSYIAITSAADSSFVEKAIQGNRQEIMMAQMALQKSTSADVKKIAQQMINDHQTVLDQLLNFAGNSSGKNNIPAMDSGMNNNNSALDTTMNTSKNTAMTNYDNLSGNSFDRQWVSDMLSGHLKTLNEYRTELNTNPDGGLKTILQQAIPKIQQHLTQLQTLRGRMM